MAGKEENRIFVGGLSWNVTERQLHHAFEPFGKIVECQIVMERDTGRPRGFGFITFANRRGMEDAILAMNGQEFGDRVISVNKANKAQRKMVGEDLEHGYWGGGYSSGGRGSYGGGNSSAGQDDCFKCGWTGHWARECPLARGEDLDHGYRGGGYSSGRKGSYGGGDKSAGKDGCFKCGRLGHWARDCPLTGGDDLEDGYRGGGYLSGGRGSYGGGDRSAGKDGCFKCGRPGHRARDCFLAGGDQGGVGGSFSSRSRFGGGGGRGDRFIDDHYDGGHNGDGDCFDNREDNYGSRDHLLGDRASCEVPPDNMYNTAQVISSRNDSIPDVNITHVFPVMSGFKYLVGLHFCDIASISFVEIIKLNNSMGSLVGKVTAEFILNSWTRGNMSVLVVAVCLLVYFLAVLFTLTERHPISWVLGSQQLCHTRQEDLLGDFNLEEKEMFRLMQEGMRIKQEKLRLEQVKEEERIMMTDTSGMSQIQQKYYHRRKKEILQGRSRNS
ncbi:hypothetical protein FH972_001801 [Carpinus fangiana]|uniref:Uncharacterized protein n=1 Tax=Carpinus fangiana TaxID=176857 RepID=A0A5N6QD79_9ROSI|nr:hypothetical protein FH972_001801 [Carpinus fangiana]